VILVLPACARRPRSAPADAATPAAVRVDAAAPRPAPDAASAPRPDAAAPLVQQHAALPFALRFGMTEDQVSATLRAQGVTRDSRRQARARGFLGLEDVDVRLSFRDGRLDLVVLSVHERSVPQRHPEAGAGLGRVLQRLRRHLRARFPRVRPVTWATGFTIQEDVVDRFGGSTGFAIIEGPTWVVDGVRYLPGAKQWEERIEQHDGERVLYQHAWAGILVREDTPEARAEVDAGARAVGDADPSARADAGAVSAPAQR
jgi:hypothetical protein